MMRYCVLLMALALAVPAPAFRLPIKLYRNSDGLPQEQVRTIAQDSKGRIYIGTVGGVGIFNGRDFTRLGVRQGLPAEDIYSIVVDPLDRAWIGTPYGLAVLEQGTVRVVPFPDYIDTSIIRMQMSDGLYFQNRQGVYRLKEGEFTYLSSGTVRAFTLGPDGALYIAGPEGLRVHRGGNETVHPLSGVDAASVLTLRRDGTLLIGAQNGLFLWDGSAVRVLLAAVPVTDCREDEEGDIWLSSEIGGLHHFRRGTWNRYAFVGDTRLNQAYCVFEDRERNIWFGTVSGMGKVPYRQFGIYDMQDGLPEFLPSCIYEDPRGLLHVGFLGGTAVFDPASDRFHREEPPLPGGVTVRAMGTDPKGRLVLGTADNGLFVRDQGGITAVRAVAGFTVARVYDMLEDPHRGLWIATRAGLFLSDAKEYRLFTTAQGLPSNTCYGLGLDRDGRLLVCTQRGVAVFDGSVFSVPQPLHGVTCEVNTILCAADGALWIGTHGFGLMELRGGNLTVHDETRGFPNDFVWGITEDAKGVLWVASNKGIHRRQGDRWLTFNSRDGFPGDEIFIHTAKADRKGDLWFGFPYGLVRVFAGRDKPNAILPGLQVDRIVTPQAAHPVLPGPMEFVPEERDLRFEYTAFSYQNEEQVYYRTRLDPIEEEWSEPTRLNSLHYPRLGPGQYRFQVQACNNSLLWTKQPALVDFRILPFFHETWWFRGLIALAGLLLVAGGLLWRLHAVTRAKIKLERLVRERTEELKGKVEIIESLSRTDPLTNVYNRRYFVDRFEQVVAFSKRYDEPFCFVIIDIDNFKQINDTLGHLVGDRILVEFSQLLVEGFRETDLLARYGGDEFVVLMQKAEPQGVRLRVEKFLQTLREHVFAGDSRVQLTFSAGIAYIWPKAVEHITFDWVAGTADRFMYEAKRAGKNCVLFKEIKAS